MLEIMVLAGRRPASYGGQAVQRHVTATPYILQKANANGHTMTALFVQPACQA